MRRVLIALLLSLVMAATASAETLTIRSDIWPPYNDAPKSIKPGYMI